MATLLACLQAHILLSRFFNRTDKRCIDHIILPWILNRTDKRCIDQQTPDIRWERPAACLGAATPRLPSRPMGRQRIARPRVSCNSVRPDASVNEERGCISFLTGRGPPQSIFVWLKDSKTMLVSILQFPHGCGDIVCTIAS